MKDDVYEGTSKLNALKFLFIFHGDNGKLVTTSFFDVVALIFNKLGPSFQKIFGFPKENIIFGRAGSHECTAPFICCLVANRKSLKASLSGSNLTIFD